MKLNSALAKSLLMAASMGMVTPVLAQTFPRPAKPAQPAPAPAPDEEAATIEGIEVTRKNGGYLGVTVNGPRLVLKFYDNEKKPAPLDVARAAARWNRRPPRAATGAWCRMTTPTPWCGWAGRNRRWT